MTRSRPIVAAGRPRITWWIQNRILKIPLALPVKVVMTPYETQIGSGFCSKSIHNYGYLLRELRIVLAIADEVIE